MPKRLLKRGTRRVVRAVVSPPSTIELANQPTPNVTSSPTVARDLEIQRSLTQ